MIVSNLWYLQWQHLKLLPSIWRTFTTQPAQTNVIKFIIEFHVRSWTNSWESFLFFNTSLLESYFCSIHLWVFEKLKNTPYQKFRDVFWTVKLFCMIQKWIDVIIYLSKSIGCATPRLTSNVNYGHWAIILCHCKFIDSDTCATLEEFDSGGDRTYVGQHILGKFLYLLLSFVVNLKLL